MTSFLKIFVVKQGSENTRQSVHGFCFLNAKSSSGIFRNKFFFWPVFLLLFLPIGLSSQTRQEVFQDRIYKEFIGGTSADWERTLIEMEAYQQRNPSPAMLYDLLLARYGFIAVCLDQEEADRARLHLDRAEQELELLRKHSAYLSRVLALEGAFLGFRISLRPLSAMRLGPRSYRAIDAALEADPNNPAAWMEKGNSRFYTPSAFGGSKQEARDSYLKAVELFEKNMQLNQRWLYLNSVVGLAKSYEYTNQQSLAIATYEKALAFEPGFKWVRDELLPQAKLRK